LSTVTGYTLWRGGVQLPRSMQPLGGRLRLSARGVLRVLVDDVEQPADTIRIPPGQGRHVITLLCHARSDQPAGVLEAELVV
jgi:hypothetical protein